MAEDRRDQVNLPPRPFLYTLDQLVTLLSYSDINALKRAEILFFMGRQPGRGTPDEIRVHNIAPPDKQPDWRCEEKELIRWMKRKGFSYVGR